MKNIEIRFYPSINSVANGYTGILPQYVPHSVATLLIDG